MKRYFLYLLNKPSITKVYVNNKGPNNWTLAKKIMFIMYSYHFGINIFSSSTAQRISNIKLAKPVNNRIVKILTCLLGILLFRK